MFAAKALKRSGDVLRLHLRAAAHRSFSSAAAPCSDSAAAAAGSNASSRTLLGVLREAQQQGRFPFACGLLHPLLPPREGRLLLNHDSKGASKDHATELRSSKVWVASPNEELDKTSFMISSWIRKLWVPTLAVLTVILGWQYPVSLAVNLLLLVWSTKPTPASIHIWLEERRMEAAIQKQGLDRFKHQLNFSLVKHIQVEDHLLFCLARVSGLTESIVLLGFLGNWWVLHSSTVFLKY
ncbi:uncharacterized protein LOC112347027 [Selaginella moellendorffii]|uniref:uncharacterized protein LOC112347027 n=1 Tax=Selaginella moellendorffii TaxID=88036 RepID=UPI000D1C9BC7|nr:uncharacterized protein LOC112347027 [Selaginella moellendorffii]|eukprot:XP_024532899.1 uncharacterized protein LOC112347027 [Selaginella moellendorffii]